MESLHIYTAPVFRVPDLPMYLLFQCTHRCSIWAPHSKLRVTITSILSVLNSSDISFGDCNPRRKNAGTFSFSPSRETPVIDLAFQSSRDSISSGMCREASDYCLNGRLRRLKLRAINSVLTRLLEPSRQVDANEKEICSASRPCPIRDHFADGLRTGSQRQAHH